MITTDDLEPLPSWTNYKFDVLDALTALDAEAAWNENAARRLYVLGRTPADAAQAIVAGNAPDDRLTR